MKILKDMMAQMTGPGVLDALTALLREKDKNFPPLEARFEEAAANIRRILGPEGTPDFEKHLADLRQEVTAQMVYAGHLGYQANLMHFRSPSGNRFLPPEFPDLLKEHIMTSMPMCTAALNRQSSYFTTLPDAAKEQHAVLTEYFCWLETTGPKLAHFAGYRFANAFLPWAEPGYQPDVAQTICYASALEKYLNLPPASLLT